MGNPVTKNITINSTSADQISFIIDLTHLYNESKFVGIRMNFL